MRHSRHLLSAATLGALCLLAPAQAHAGEKFYIKNCSNHAFSVDIAIVDWFKASRKTLHRHDSITMDCISSKCNVGVTWSADGDEGTSFEHLYTDLNHGHYVIQMKTKRTGGTPSVHCIKTYAMKKGDSCDVFDEDSTEYHQKLYSMIGAVKHCN
jgi:hypothetical protein